MNLKHLKEERCPTCGNPTKGIAVTATHCNGQQFESRTYECGHEVKWVPNFDRMEVARRCPKDPEEVASKEGERKACAELLGIIERKKWPESFKKALLYDIDFSVRHRWQ